MIVGYARVSTDGQTVDAQVKQLHDVGAEKIFREAASGAKTDRRELARVIRPSGRRHPGCDAVRPPGAIHARPLEDPRHDSEGRTGFRSLGDAWADTTTPHGRLMLTVLGGLAEFERELIRARTGEGRERAKARGVHMGRPPRLTAHQKAEAAKVLADGTATQADLARRINVSQSTISRLAV